MDNATKDASKLAGAHDLGLKVANNKANVKATHSLLQGKQTTLVRQKCKVEKESMQVMR